LKGLAGYVEVEIEEAGETESFQSSFGQFVEMAERGLEEKTRKGDSGLHRGSDRERSTTQFSCRLTGFPDV
jgi:hypothetical protein